MDEVPPLRKYRAAAAPTRTHRPTKTNCWPSVTPTQPAPQPAWVLVVGIDSLMTTLALLPPRAARRHRRLRDARRGGDIHRADCSNLREMKSRAPSA